MRRRRQAGFTLLEVLVAMIMFTIITAATSFALNAALQAQAAARRRADELQEVRTVLSVISRDLRASWVSLSNPYTFFIGGTDPNTVLQFTTLTHRVLLSADPSQDATDPTNSLPQSDVALVRYYLDSSSGQLSRSESAVPNPDTLPDPGRPDTVLSSHVRSMNLQFYDPNNGLMPSWSFTLTPPASGTGAPTLSTDGNQTLPTSVQIAVDFAFPDGREDTYTTSVTLLTPTPEPIGQKPATTTTATPGGGTPGGGTPGGGTPGGGTPGGGRPGG